jgi:hypothetical protein
MRLRTISEKKCCPSCGKKFPKSEPYPDVENCETCERFGPPKSLNESDYDGLEDADEFRGPIWDEFRYRYVGEREGHWFVYQGNSYWIPIANLSSGLNGGSVYMDTEYGKASNPNWEFIAKAGDPVPWPELEYHAIGEHLPAQRLSWDALVRQLNDIPYLRWPSLS